MRTERVVGDGWTILLSNHGRVLIAIAEDPTRRLRDIAAVVGLTERSAYEIVNDLHLGGVLVRGRIGRRNTYRIVEDYPAVPGHPVSVADLIRMFG